MPNNKKYQIFISSTYSDLITERDAVRNVILEMYQFPIGMEMFSADDEDQWTVIKDAIDTSDYYVIIVGRKYGSIVENGSDAGISYTEKEFRYAQTTGIPILSFVIKDDASRSGNQIETDPEKLSKLQTFTEYVKNGRLVSFWSNADELAREVSTALHKQIDRGKRPGWIRADNIEWEKITVELAESSKRIRELEEENRELRKQVSDRKPILSINFGIDVADEEDDEDKKHLDLFKTSPQVKINGTGLDIQIKNIKPVNYSDRYAQLEYDDRARRLGVTQEEIDEYNRQLPSIKKIQEINDYSTAHKEIVNNGVAFHVDINNTGTAKATDVRVNIISPDEIVLYDLDEIEKHDKLKLPKLPENPIVKAEEKRRKRRMGLMNPDLYNLGALISPYDNISHIIPDIPSMVRYAGGPIHERTDVKDNEVKIEKDQVLHPNGDRFRRFYMIPKTSGSFALQCEIMCSEFEKPIHQEIIVNVTEVGEV